MAALLAGWPLKYEYVSNPLHQVKGSRLHSPFAISVDRCFAIPPYFR